LCPQLFSWEFVVGLFERYLTYFGFRRPSSSLLLSSLSHSHRTKFCPLSTITSPLPLCFSKLIHLGRGSVLQEGPSYPQHTDGCGMFVFFVFFLCVFFCLGLRVFWTIVLQTGQCGFPPKNTAVATFLSATLVACWPNFDTH